MVVIDYIQIVDHLVWRACSIVALPGVDSCQNAVLNIGDKKLLRGCIKSLAILSCLQNVKPLSW